MEVHENRVGAQVRMGRDDDVTGLLTAWGQGDPTADSRLMAVVYNDLRRVARRRLRGERDHSLVPTGSRGKSKGSRRFLRFV